MISYDAIGRAILTCDNCQREFGRYGDLPSAQVRHAATEGQCDVCRYHQAVATPEAVRTVEFEEPVEQHPATSAALDRLQRRREEREAVERQRREETARVQAAQRAQIARWKQLWEPMRQTIGQLREANVTIRGQRLAVPLHEPRYTTKIGTNRLHIRALQTTPPQLQILLCHAFAGSTPSEEGALFNGKYADPTEALNALVDLIAQYEDLPTDLHRPPPIGREQYRGLIFDDEVQF